MRGHVFKVLFLGAKGTGKTLLRKRTVLHKRIEQKADFESEEIKEVEFAVAIAGSGNKLQIWDFPNREDLWLTIADIEKDLFVIFYNSADSFEKVERIVNFIKSKNWNEKVVIWFNPPVDDKEAHNALEESGRTFVSKANGATQDQYEFVKQEICALEQENIVEFICSKIPRDNESKNSADKLDKEVNLISRPVAIAGTICVIAAGGLWLALAMGVFSHAILGAGALVSILIAVMPLLTIAFVVAGTGLLIASGIFGCLRCRRDVMQDEVEIPKFGEYIAHVKPRHGT